MATFDKERIEKDIAALKIETRQKTNESLDAFIANIIRDKKSKEIFSDSYFDKISSRLDKLHSKMNSLHIFMIVIAVVMIAGALHRDMSLNIAGVSISKLDVFRDFLFFAFISAALLADFNQIDIDILLSILSNRYDNIKEETKRLYATKYQYQMGVGESVKTYIDALMSLGEPTRIANKANVRYFTLIMFCMFICIISIVIAAACANFAFLMYAIYTLLSEPIEPVWISYFIACYAFIVIIFEICLFLFKNSRWSYDDYWPLYRLGRLNDIHPEQFEENLRQVKREMAG